MQINGFRMSRHALQRALDMQLDGETIRRCLTSPHRVEPCRRYREFTLYHRDDITCSVHTDTNLVGTILWRTEKAWATDLKDKPGYQGREFRKAQ